MTTNKTLNLIEGKFQIEDAKEVLRSIFTAKINYHQMKNFSSLERFGKEDEKALERTTALKNELIKLEGILAEAAANNNHLIIGSEINIQFSEE